MNTTVKIVFVEHDEPRFGVTWIHMTDFPGVPITPDEDKLTVSAIKDQISKCLNPYSFPAVFYDKWWITAFRLGKDWLRLNRFRVVEFINRLEQAGFMEIILLNPFGDQYIGNKEDQGN